VSGIFHIHSGLIEGLTVFIAPGLATVAVWLVLADLAAAAYLFHAASQTSQLLAQIRSQLLFGVGEPPFADEP
jgi:hypothetical protein